MQRRLAIRFVDHRLLLVILELEEHLNLVFRQQGRLLYLWRLNLWKLFDQRDEFRLELIALIHSNWTFLFDQSRMILRLGVLFRLTLSIATPMQVLLTPTRAPQPMLIITVMRFIRWIDLESDFAILVIKCHQLVLLHAILAIDDGLLLCVHAVVLQQTLLRVSSKRGLDKVL